MGWIGESVGSWVVDRVGGWVVVVGSSVVLAVMLVAELVVELVVDGLEVARMGSINRPSEISAIVFFPSLLSCELSGSLELELAAV